VHDLADSEKHCQTCQQDLRPIGEESSEHYEYIPAQLTVVENVCKKYACDCTVKNSYQAAATDRKEYRWCQPAGAGDRGQNRRSFALTPAREDL